MWKSIITTFIVAGAALAACDNEPATNEEPTFSLNCKTRYTGKVDGDRVSGSHAFTLTVDAREGQLYMSDWRVTGLGMNGYNKSVARMDGELTRIRKIDDDEIKAGALTINRRSGKVEGPDTVGECTKRSSVKPIPGKAF